MPMELYLAMTAGEMAHCSKLPERPAYMACHFSPYRTGIHNCPDSLPEGAMLILNDRTPVCGHDPQAVAHQLQKAVEQTGAASVLLDLQRPEVAETEQIVRAVTETLRCPVAVSQWYARGLQCPVFVSAPPPEADPEMYLAPWKGRQIWLEAALTAREYTITEQASVYADLPAWKADSACHRDMRLHCCYRVTVTPEQVRVTLWRDAQCLQTLLEQVRSLGVSRAVGLYQQLGGKE